MDLWDQQAAEIAAPAATNRAGAAIASQNRSSAPLVACCFKQVSGSPATTPRPGLRAEPDDCVMLAAAASLGSFVSSQIERAVDVSVDVVDAASAWVVGAETDASLEDLKGREINGEAELREAARALFRLAESDRRAQSLLAGADPEAAQAEAASLPTHVIADAGRTQVAAGSVTVGAIGPAAVADIDTRHSSIAFQGKTCCKCVASGSSTPSHDNPQGHCGAPDECDGDETEC